MRNMRLKNNITNFFDIGLAIVDDLFNYDNTEEIFMKEDNNFKNST